MKRKSKVFMKGAQLRNELFRSHWSQNALARRLNITSGYMSQLLNGARHPSPKMRAEMMGKLNRLRKFKGLKAYTFDDLFTIRKK